MALDYITENPFLDRMNQRRGEFSNQSIRDAQLSYEQQKLKEYMANEQLRRRELESGVRTSESGMRVAEGTEGFDIERSGYDTRRSGTQAEQAEQDLSTALQRDPYTIRQAQTQAEQSEFNLGEDRATAPDERRRVRAQADQAQSNASLASDRRKMENFESSMEALKAGNTDLAEYYAGQNGQQIPEEIKRNVQLQYAVAQLWENAKSIYPNQPRAQLQYMQQAMQALVTEAGDMVYNPQTALNVPGAPTPPAQASNALSGSASTGVEAGGLSASDRRLLQSVENANKQSDPRNPFGTPQVDGAAVAQHLLSIGRPELAQLYDPNIQPPAASGYASGGGASPSGMQGGAQSANAPQPGTVEDGYEFLGGDPADPQNWRPVH